MTQLRGRAAARITKVVTINCALQQFKIPLSHKAEKLLSVSTKLVSTIIWKSTKVVTQCAISTNLVPQSTVAEAGDEREPFGCDDAGMAAWAHSQTPDA
ncbi:hypothetical protein [Burkholderia vietnamiensis]|uniref:hypothetical protein n=1 Tax=Burkholderia vietnamiensis TaxID=60552 RepID=UPI0012DA9E57|nr:hypothetical protein [Burkholderia vietnamiensis]